MKKACERNLWHRILCPVRSFTSAAINWRPVQPTEYVRRSRVGTLRVRNRKDYLN